MIVPSAMFIEAAQDMLKTVAPEQLAAQLKEFKFAVGPNASDDLCAGYQLGLQTLRALIATTGNAHSL